MRPRLIPVLLLDSRRRLVKTQSFCKETYVGDPFNVVRIFNEKEVDEICVLDINASLEGRPPDLEFLQKLSNECFMPLSYGGGISSLALAAPLFEAGIEKVVLGTGGMSPELIQEISAVYGSQAVTVCADCRRVGNDWRVFTNRGRRDSTMDPVSYCRRAVAAGAGEIILQSIDADGQRTGYDLGLIEYVASALDVPVVALGGAGEAHHFAAALRAGASAAASGSAFVFIGKLRAVLITYPTEAELLPILAPSN